MTRIIVAINIIVISIVTSSVAIAHAPAFNAFVVDFSVNKGKGEVTADQNGQGCANGQGNKKGCVRFAKNTIGTITFALKPQIKQCADAGTKWVITRIEMTHKGYELTGGIVSDKGIFDGGLPNWLQDSYPNVDVDGVLYKADQNEGLTRVTRLNLNNSTTLNRNYWYRVTVSSCDDDPVVLVSDPRLENGGTDIP